MMKPKLKQNGKMSKVVHGSKQGQTVHKLQIATFGEIYLYIYISIDKIVIL